MSSYQCLISSNTCLPQVFGIKSQHFGTCDVLESWTTSPNLEGLATGHLSKRINSLAKGPSPTRSLFSNV
jgi:hypothetical protein